RGEPARCSQSRPPEPVEDMSAQRMARRQPRMLEIEILGWVVRHPELLHEMPHHGLIGGELCEGLNILAAPRAQQQPRGSQGDGHRYFVFPRPPSWDRNISCSCSNPLRVAGSHVFSIVSGSIALRVARKRSSTSGKSASCSGLTSGSPRKARASSGVQSISTLNFIALTPPAPGDFDPICAKTHLQERNSCSLAAMTVEIPFRRELSFEYGRLEPIAPMIRRIVAPNPSPFTFRGTGTYIVGQGEVAVIDPGPDLADHVGALLAGLMGEQVTHILVTHTH